MQIVSTLNKYNVTPWRRTCNRPLTSQTPSPVYEANIACLSLCGFCAAVSEREPSSILFCTGNWVSGTFGNLCTPASFLATSASSAASSSSTSSSSCTDIRPPMISLTSCFAYCQRPNTVIPALLVAQNHKEKKMRGRRGEGGRGRGGGGFVNEMYELSGKQSLPPFRP